MNAQHSEVFKMVCHDLLIRLVPPYCRLKALKNLLFSAKMACFRSFLLKKANSLELSDNSTEELDVLKDHDRPF